MSQTYHQLTKHIAELQAQAESVKRSEVASVISKAKDAIQVYGLTRQDLFAGKGARPAKVLKPAKGPKGKKVKSTEAKYADGKGGFWVGRGKRPLWLSDRLKAGSKLDDFLISTVSTAEPNPAANEPTPALAAPDGVDVTPAPKKRASVKAAAKKAQAKSIVKKAAKAKYQDGAGNSWSGFGPRPKWLKDAIAGGKHLEDLLG
jgi:DNA-binding protein H-NS